ncbi:MAG: ATP-binding protein [Solirubrobacterales bacterium]
MLCPTCGKDSPGDFAFCPFCGAALVEAPPRAGREERKVVTAVFCDLVGFTSRAERLDPEDVRALLVPYHDRVRSELERHGGTVEKFIGDAVMAVFGAPVAHEDDPERAVRAALAIRDWAREEGIELRIGVNTGEALVSLDSEPLATGDVVNTAARLEAAAPSGGILVGEVTHRTTRDAIDYTDHPAVEAKGKAERVAVWQALQAKSRVKVDREARAPLVGRRRELALLHNTLDLAAGERKPQLITLVGVPGIGKSRLVFELYKTIEASPEFVYWRYGRSLPYGEGVSFWPLAEMVKAQAGILETDGAEEAATKLNAAIEAVAGEEDPRWLERHLRPLVGLEAEAPTGDARGEAFTAWRRFLESLAEEGLLVLVFDDIHWADDALLDFVDHLVDWAADVPLLVVATARPELLERRPGWGGGKPNATTLSLSPLSDDETAKLLHALLESPVLAASTQADLLARAGGNPLYAEEFARLVSEDRPPDDLPESVQGLIAARLDALADEEKLLLQAASVVGKVFWLGAVSAIAEVDRPRAEASLHALERKEFVRRERHPSVAGEEEYAFRHALMRDVAYAQIPRAGRADKHRRAAEWIESLGRPQDHAEMLAHHDLEALELARASGSADDALVNRARVSARRAGDRALSLNAAPAAERFFSSALELSPPDDPERPELMFLVGLARHRIEPPEAEELLEDAARELVAAGRTQRAAEAHALLAETWWLRGKRGPTYDQLARARELVGPEESEAKARVLARLARLQMLSGEDEDAILTGGEALTMAERLGLEDVQAHVLNTVGCSRFQTGDESGKADLERSIEIALASNPDVAAVSYNNLAHILGIGGDLRRDAELRGRAAAIAERFGDGATSRFQRGLEPQFDYAAGRWDDSVRKAAAFIAECEAGSPHYVEPTSFSCRALIALARGDLEGATADSSRAERLARESGDPQVLLPTLGVRLRVERELNRPRVAATIASEAITIRPDHTTPPAPIELAWAADPLGLTDAARDWIRRIPFPSKWTEAATAILDGNLDTAADLFAEIGSLPDEARARLAAARALLADGRQAEAGRQLQRALDFYRSVGADAYVRNAEGLLAA